MPAGDVPGGMRTPGSGPGPMWRAPIRDHRGWGTLTREGCGTASNSGSRFPAGTGHREGVPTSAMTGIGDGADARGGSSGTARRAGCFDGLVVKYETMTVEPVGGVGAGSMSVIDVGTDAVAVTGVRDAMDGDDAAGA